MARKQRPTIGVFDSGFGGLTVLKALLELIPEADYLYFGDTARLPYGSKSVETVARYAVEAAHYLEAHGAQVLVIGGDHGATIPALDALDAVGEPVYIVHVDAHLDWRAEVGGVTRGYSSPLRWASTKPYVLGMTQIGLRFGLGC